MHIGGDLAPEHRESRMVDRMLFFSDAVFAIVLTLLVLELRPPEGASEAAFVEAMRALTPKFIAFGASFALVSIFWSAHMTITRRLAIFDWPSAWLNLIFLFTIAVMPFASALLGAQGGNGIAWQTYCGVLVAASAAQTVLVVAITRDKGRLIGGIGWRERWWRISRALSPGIAFGTGLWLSYEGERVLSVLCWTLIPVVLLVARVAFGSRQK